MIDVAGGEVERLVPCGDWVHDVAFGRDDLIVSGARAAARLHSCYVPVGTLCATVRKARVGATRHGHQCSAQCRPCQKARLLQPVATANKDRRVSDATRSVRPYAQITRDAA